MKYLLCSLILFLGGFRAVAQAPSGRPFVLGVTDKVHSAALGEDRILNIYLPDGYKENAGRAYPVIYLLDGSANEDFIHVCGLVQFLNMIGYMPSTVVVGIANVDRKRDFTFPSALAGDLQKIPNAGGAAKFIQFMHAELKPYISSHYRVNDSTTLIGQSLGGLLATQLLLEQPGLFRNYIIVSPSLWWNKESLLTRAVALMPQAVAATTVYISAGGREPGFMKKDAKRLSRLLKKGTAMNIHWQPEPHESHLTILHNCLYHALVRLNGH